MSMCSELVQRLADFNSKYLNFVLKLAMFNFKQETNYNARFPPNINSGVYFASYFLF